jgi:hypothetical protein
MAPISRGFVGRRRTGVDPARVPPGQYVTGDFPVLSAGPTPHTALGDWSFTVGGAVDKPVSWTWEEFRSLPTETVTVDIHCVTKWSKLDTVWTGVSLDVLLGAVETTAGYVTAFSDGGYTTNLPRSELTGGRHGSPSATTASRSRSPTSTSGRARSGYAASSCATAMNPDSGKTTATTITATHGRSSDTRETELAAGHGARVD